MPSTDRLRHSGIATFLDSEGTEIRFVRGVGGLVFDTHGREYLDFVLGFGPVVLGHAHPGFTKLVQRALEEGAHFPGFSQAHRECLDVLLDGRPATMTGTFFRSGSEAVAAAVRLARAKTKRRVVIQCGYLGWHDEFVTGNHRWHLPPGWPDRARPREVVGVMAMGNTHPWLSGDLGELDLFLKQHGDDVAAFCFDAFQIECLPDNTIRSAIAMCSRHGALTIADETKTAGRAAPLGASVALDLSWDLLIAGKALANGLAFSVLLGDDSVMSLAGKCRVGGTFSKEVFAVQCALATQGVMCEEGGYALLRTIGLTVVTTLRDAVTAAGCAELVAVRLMFGGTMIFIEVPERVGVRASARDLSHAMSRRGLLLLVNHPSFVCLSHEAMDMTGLYERMVGALRDWAGAR